MCARKCRCLHPFIPFAIGVLFGFCLSGLCWQISWDARKERMRDVADAKSIKFLKDAILTWEQEVRGSDEQ